MSVKLLHLTSSTFHGGPERQMLGLAQAIAPAVDTAFLSFNEGGRCREFLEQARRLGFEANALDYDTPHLCVAVRELTERLRTRRADVLFVHGYKAGLLGRIAARRVGIPVVAVSRGWTYESDRVRLYETLDRINLRWMDRVVCVSRGQATTVRKAGVPQRKIVVIPNAVDCRRFDNRNPASRRELEQLFPRRVQRIVGAAGRLSPEKGFSVLIAAAEIVTRSNLEIGFVLFGEGVLGPALAEQAAARSLSDKFVLAGFRPDLDRLLSSLDLLVQSSFTEGMPNVILEACAAGVPVVATAVGGTPEILEGGLEGQLVLAGDPGALARRILETLSDECNRRMLGELGRQKVVDCSTFEAQARMYRGIIREIIPAAAEHPSYTTSFR